MCSVPEASSTLTEESVSPTMAPSNLGVPCVCTRICVREYVGTQCV